MQSEEDNVLSCRNVRNQSILFFPAPWININSHA